MPSLPASAESVRAVNAKIGQNYDTLPYDAHPDPELDPERVGAQPMPGRLLMFSTLVAAPERRSSGWAR
jgi:hypothetical protein